MEVMLWQPMRTALTDGQRIWLAFSTGPELTDWNMAACRYSNVGWYLSPNGEIGSPVHFIPINWMQIPRPPKEVQTASTA